MERSPRNKTIDFSLDSDEGKKYSSRSPRVEDITSGYNIYDRMFCGDTFEVCRRLPEAFADLIIVDPPYNLSKNYHGNRFGSCSHGEYREFTEKWMDAVLPLLKPNGTVYVCCDWYSGMIISEELEKRLTLRGRITWQREKGRGAESNWKNCMEDVWYVKGGEREGVEDKIFFF